MLDFGFWYIYSWACVLMYFAALARKHSVGASFGFLALSVIATPVLAYAFLMAMPVESVAAEKSQ